MIMKNRTRLNKINSRNRGQEKRTVQNFFKYNNSLKKRLAKGQCSSLLMNSWFYYRQVLGSLWQIYFDIGDGQGEQMIVP